MSEVADQNLSEEEIWKAHILKARASKLADVKYCQKNELSVWRFTSFKKKLGLTNPKKPKLAGTPKPSSFVKVVPSESPLQPSSVASASPSRMGLPDAGWLAEFVTALLSQR
jgi:hypothetical protein